VGIQRVIYERANGLKPAGQQACFGRQPGLEERQFVLGTVPVSSVIRRLKELPIVRLRAKQGNFHRVSSRKGGIFSKPDYFSKLT
jgi:hypothetical protein